MLKAERINKNQIRFTLNKADLQARQLKITDLSYGSDKTKALFDDMMQQAITEFGFDATSGKPLMIEAIPISDDSLMITVTQVNGHEDLLSLFRANLPGADSAHGEADFHYDSEEKQDSPSPSREVTIVYTMADFKDVISAARLIQPTLRLRNQLYRDEKTGAYHLLLQYSRLNSQIRYVMTLLTEYASGISKDALWISHIQEHCRLAVHSRALQKLAAMEQQTD